MTTRQESSDSHQKTKHQEKCQSIIDYIFGKGPFPLSDMNRLSVINKQQMAHMNSQREQKNQEGTKCVTIGKQKTDRDEQSHTELKSEIRPNIIVYLRLDKEKPSPDHNRITHDTKLDSKKPTSAERLTPSLTDKALGAESLANHDKKATLNTAHNTDDNSSTIIETKYKDSNVLNENGLQKDANNNYNMPGNDKKSEDTITWTEQQNKNYVIQKLGISHDIDKAKVLSDVSITEKKCAHSTRDDEIFQIELPLRMNQFGELHSKASTKLNVNIMEVDHARKLQETKTLHNQEQKSDPRHPNFRHDEAKIADEVSSKLQYLPANIETKADCLNSYNHQEQPEPENLNLERNVNKPSEILAKNAEPKTNEVVLDTKITKDFPISDIIEVLMTRHRVYRSQGSAEPTCLFKSNPSDNLCPRRQRASNHFKWIQQIWTQEKERQERQSHAHPFIRKQDQPLKKLTTQAASGPTRHETESLSTETIVIPVYIQYHDQSIECENLNLEHNVHKQSVDVSKEPSQLFESKTEIKTHTHAEQEDLYHDHGPEQESNNTPDGQKSYLSTTRPLTDLNVSDNMPLSEILQIVRMRNQHLDTKDYQESGDMTKCNTGGSTSTPPTTLPKGPCRSGHCPPGRLCPKCPEPTPCPTKPCDYIPLKKLCDPCRSPKTCDTKFAEAKDILGVLTRNFRSNIPPKVVITRNCDVPTLPEMNFKEGDSGLATSEISNTFSMEIKSRIAIPNFPFDLQSLFPQCSSINSIPKRLSTYENPQRRFTDPRESSKNSPPFQWGD